MSFDIKDAQMVAITGVSESGETSLLNCLGLIQDLNSDNLFIDGKDCTNGNEKDKTNFWRNTAALIYPNYGIIDEESVHIIVPFPTGKQTRKRQKIFAKSRFS